MQIQKKVFDDHKDAYYQGLQDEVVMPVEALA